MCRRKLKVLGSIFIINAYVGKPNGCVMNVVRVSSWTANRLPVLARASCSSSKTTFDRSRRNICAPSKSSDFLSKYIISWKNQSVCQIRAQESTRVGKSCIIWLLTFCLLVSPALGYRGRRSLVAPDIELWIGTSPIRAVKKNLDHTGTTLIIELWRSEHGKKV